MGGVDVALSALDHHHGAIVQVGHALAQFLAFLNNVDPHFLAWENDGLQGVGQFVHVQDLYALELGDPV